MRIYIAAPYSAPSLDARCANMRKAQRAAIELIRAGHTPYCPHLTRYLDVEAKAIGQPIDYEEWMAYDREWLRLCDAVLCLGRSPGADRECELARAMGLPIVWDMTELETIT